MLARFGILMVLIVTAFISIPWSAWGAENPVLINAGQIKIRTSPARLNPATQNFEVTVTLVNRSKRLFYDPVYIEVSKIMPRGTRLVNAAGSSPRGNQWVRVPLAKGELAPNDSTSAVLIFSTPRSYFSRHLITFRSAVYASLSRSNTPPVANAGADRTVVRGKAVTLDGSASTDADGNPLTFEWSLLQVPEGSQAVLSDPSLVNPTITPDKVGNYEIRLIVSDGYEKSVPDTVLLSTINTAPVANAGADQTGKVGATVVLDGSGSSDNDGDPLNYRWGLLEKPAGSKAALSDPTALRPSLTLDKPGTYICQLVVEDGDAESEPDNVTVSTINSEPVADAGPDRTGRIGQPLILDGSASTDVDGDYLTYHWSLVTRPDGSNVSLSDETAVRPSVQPDKRGSYVFQLIVNDGKVDSLPDAMTLTTENSPPIADAGVDRTGRLDEALILDGSASSDVDGDLLKYRWSLIGRPSNSNAEFDEPNSVTPRITLDRPGDYVAQLIVNDGIVDSAPDTATLTTINSKPIANAGTDQNSVVGQKVALDGNGSVDSDNDPLTFKWALITTPTGSAVQLVDSLAAVIEFTPDVAGDYIAQLIVNDGALDSDPDTALIKVAVVPPQNHAPEIRSTPVTTATVGQPYSYDVDATDEDGDVLSYTLAVSPNGMEIEPSSGVVSWLPDSGQMGLHTVTVEVSDGKGAKNNQTYNITVQASNSGISVPDLVGQSRNTAEGMIRRADLNIGTMRFEHSASASEGVVLSQIPLPGVTAARGDAVNLVISLGTATDLPPSPEVVAPRADVTVATNTYEATRFLYEGPNPVQTGVRPGAIDPKRAAVIRGRVLNKQNQPLPHVVVTVKGHPEFGQTLSRADGMFDLAVNGGGLVAIEYRSSGYLPSQRQVDISWQDITVADDVVLIGLDDKISPLDLNQVDQPFQVAQGNPVSDGDGVRTATLLMPRGVQGSVIQQDGSLLSVDSLHLSFTEYTQGANGPKAMPGPLPATSGYTYAVEITSTEAIAKVNGRDVIFDRPVPFYVDNFLEMPVGIQVPVGYWDPDKTAWLPAPDGRVVKILDVVDNIAVLDTDGDNETDTPEQLSSLGITYEERQQLAALYPAGKSFWRVPMNHLSTYDLNYGTSIRGDSKPPQLRIPDDSNPTLKNPSCSSGSVIECENQVLGETLPISGSSMTLNYRSDRVPGRRNTRITLPVTEDTLPSDLIRVELIVEVGGRRQVETRWSRGEPSPSGQMMCEGECLLPNLSYVFDWADRTDAYGQPLQGMQMATVRIGYVYRSFYNLPPNVAASFGSTSGKPVPGNVEARVPVTLWQEKDVRIGGWSAPSLSLGGWSLSAHHAYDPLAKTLYRGDGTQQKAQGQAAITIRTLAGWMNGVSLEPLPVPPASVPARSVPIYPSAFAVGPDGTVYVTRDQHYPNSVYKLTPEGRIQLVAGNGMPGNPYGGAFAGDGGPAVQAELNNPTDVAVGPDGSLYIADRGNHRVRKVSPEGIISTVAGKGCADGSDLFPGNQPIRNTPPATAVCLPDPSRLAVAGDGSLYIQISGYYVFKVAPDGGLSHVAGAQIYGGYGQTDDGIPATDAWFFGSLEDIALGPDGSLFLANRSDCRIRKVTPDGLITTVAGKGDLWQQVDGVGGPALEARIGSSDSLDVGPDGSVYFFTAVTNQILRVMPDGILTHVAGKDIRNYAAYPENFEAERPAVSTYLNGSNGLTVARDGGIYLRHDSAGGNQGPAIGRIGTSFPAFQASDLAVPSPDGQEIYRFDPNGRHLSTVHALTGAVLYEFGYDSAGRLTQVTNGDGLVTTIERDATGDIIAIVAPFGQRTALTLDANGYLASVTNPAGETRQMQYTSFGLMTRFQDAEGHASSMAYDTDGLLIADTDAAGGSQTLARTVASNGWKVTRTTELGRATQYSIGNDVFLSTRGTALPDGTSEVTQEMLNLSREISMAEGELLEESIDFFGPDPRFGMSVPLTTESYRTFGGEGAGQITRAADGSVSFTYPTGGYKQTFSRQATLAQADNPLSLQTLTDTLKTPDERTWTSVYDAASRLFTATSAAGRITSRSIDTLGRTLTSEVDGLLAVRNSYDTKGRLTAISQGSGVSERTVSLAYDEQGYLARVTDPLGRAVDYQYDAAGRVTAQSLPDGRQVHYAYDRNGNLVALQPPGRPPHLFRYNSIGLTSAYVPPEVGAGTNQTIYEHDLDKLLTKISRPDGEVLSFAYDTRGRLSKMTLPTGEIVYGYGPTGSRLHSITEVDGGVLEFGYQGSLLNQVTWNGAVAGSVAWSFDNAEVRLKDIRVNGADPIQLQYDNDSLLTRAGDFSLNRNAQNGLVVGSALGSVTDSRGYNGFGEVTVYTAKFDSTELLKDQYTYDKLGRITEKTESVNGVTDVYSYGYDLAGRLTEVRKNGFVQSTYGYDDNGNRTRRNGSDIATYDEQDRLLSYSGTTYVYTANGELASKTEGSAVTRYRYDVLGNLKHVDLPGGNAIDYLVDGQNRRIGKKVNSVLEQGFLWQDQLKPIAELNGSNEVVSRFVYATHANVPDYMIKDGQAYRILTDHLGSPRLVIKVADGSVTQRMDYDEFGNVISDTNPGFQPFGFAGGLYDPDTGLVRFGARDYDAYTGRWTAKDPILFEGGDTSLYGYVRGDSINQLDTDGLYLGAAAASVIGVVYSCAASPTCTQYVIELTGAAIEYLTNEQSGSLPDSFEGVVVSACKAISDNVVSPIFQDMLQQATSTPTAPVSQPPIIRPASPGAGGPRLY